MIPADAPSSWYVPSSFLAINYLLPTYLSAGHGKTNLFISHKNCAYAGV